MKKSHIATLLIFLIAIPATLVLGIRLPGKWYMLTTSLVIAEILIPFFLAFEGRRPQARELVIMAVMCALAIMSRVVMPIPHFKPVFAIIMLSGIAFGPESGFMVGAIAALASNFVYGQGAHTPWQMMAYGAGGMLTGFLFLRLPRKPWLMALVGGVTAIVWVGPLLDLSSIFLIPARINWATALAIFLSGLYVNITQAVCTIVVMLALGKPLLGMLDRLKIKYGMFENRL